MKRDSISHPPARIPSGILLICLIEAGMLTAWVSFMYRAPENLLLSFAPIVVGGYVHIVGLLTGQKFAWREHKDRFLFQGYFRRPQVQQFFRVTDHDDTPSTITYRGVGYIALAVLWAICMTGFSSGEPSWR